jgi:hypothetical protein
MMRLRGLRGTPDFAPLFRELDEYDRRLRLHAGLPLAQARVLEIGFGQRPYRLVALLSRGVDARGIDLDQPVLTGTLAELAAILRRNGAQRALKSAVRHFLFDWHDRRALRSALRLRGDLHPVDRARFLVGSVGSAAIDARIAPGSLDLVFSEDVFEHIPRQELPVAIRAMRRWLGPGGLALVRVTLFTGITGGHDVEWYPHTHGQPLRRRSEPWEHLRRRRFPANTFLNELRLHEYRALFEPCFSIVEQSVSSATGRRFLTPEIRCELADYGEEELLSDEVLFVLKPRQEG